MPIDNLSLTCNVSWSEYKTNTGLQNTTYGPDSEFFNLSGVDTSVVNQIKVAVYTSIAASGSQTIDLTSLTNEVGESFSFGHVLGFFVLPVGTGSELTFGPGATNPLQWIWGGTTQTLVVPPGCGVCFSAAVGSTGAVVDGTHKTLKFTNSGGSTMTSLKVIIWGKTT